MKIFHKQFSRKDGQKISKTAEIIKSTNNKSVYHQFVNNI